jgi:hypothetical protein
VICGRLQGLKKGDIITDDTLFREMKEKYGTRLATCVHPGGMALNHP